MDSHERAEQVYQMFKDHLSSKGFHFDPHDEDKVITLTAHGEDLPIPLIIRVIEEREVVQMTSPLPGSFPEDKRVDAAVAVATINNKLMNGCFDLDMSDGEIRFRLTQSFHDNDFSEEQIIYMMIITFKTVDEYNDPLFMLAKGMMDMTQFLEKTQN